MVLVYKPPPHLSSVLLAESNFILLWVCHFRWLWYNNKNCPFGKEFSMSSDLLKSCGLRLTPQPQSGFRCAPQP